MSRNNIHLRTGFDTVAFITAIERAAAFRRMTMLEVSKETGVSNSTLSRMKSGVRTCDVASMAALSYWAGLNPMAFATFKGGTQ